MSPSRKHSNKPNATSSEVVEHVRQYTQRKPLQEEFTAKIVELLKALLRVRGIGMHLIESRTKEIDSFTGKLTRASKKYSDPLTEITDLSGVRIITYYEEDLDTICRLIEKEFEVDHENSVDKRSVMRPEEFGYQSIHYVVRLSNARSSLLEWHHLSDLAAEIQVRTVLQHAWAAISHKLQYKREEDVPRALRRRLFRLSALLELADEEFSRLRDDTVSLTEAIEKNLAGGQTNLEINLLTVEEFLRTSPAVAQLVKNAERAGFSFRDYHNEGEEGKILSELVAMCDRAGLNLIFDLKQAIEESLEWSHSYLVNQYKVDLVDWQVSPAFVCVLILIKAFPVDISFLLKAGWGKSIAENVLKVANA